MFAAAHLHSLAQWSFSIACNTYILSSSICHPTVSRLVEKNEWRVSLQVDVDVVFGWHAYHPSLIYGTRSFTDKNICFFDFCCSHLECEQGEKKRRGQAHYCFVSHKYCCAVRMSNKAAKIPIANFLCGNNFSMGIKVKPERRFLHFWECLYEMKRDSPQNLEFKSCERKSCERIWEI